MDTSAIMMELLGAGAHANPRRGASLLELTSVLAGEPWSTWPQSVHPAIAAVAQPVNDLLTEDQRQVVAPLAPWLLDTNTADPRVWPTVVGACSRAALLSSSEHDLPGLLADLDITRAWLREAGSLGGRRRRGPRAGRQDRRWARRAIRSALISVASLADGRNADAALCQMLLDCINQCRLLAGDGVVDPRLPLADCPRRLAVQPRRIRSPGCDWMEIGYEPVADLLPAHLRSSQPPQAAGDRRSHAPRLA